MLRTVDFRKTVLRRDNASDAKLLHRVAEDPVSIAEKSSRHFNLLCYKAIITRDMNTTVC